MRKPCLSLLVLLAACGGEDTNPVVPAPGDPVVAPQIQQAPTPTPTPLAGPTRTPPANRPPTVSLSFTGPSSCHPRPSQPCRVRLRAQASDLDGDPLAFAWSGCASGSDADAECVVTSPGPSEAVVEVHDPRGASARAASEARGTNEPPTRVFGAPPPQPSGRLVVLLGNVEDPEEGGVCGAQYCLDASASGPCGPSVFLDCTCLGGAYAEVRTGSGPGTCTLSVRLRDEWGAVGVAVTRFEVLAP